MGTKTSQENKVQKNRTTPAGHLAASSGSSPRCTLTAQAVTSSGPSSPLLTAASCIVFPSSRQPAVMHPSLKTNPPGTPSPFLVHCSVPLWASLRSCLEPLPHYPMCSQIQDTRYFSHAKETPIGHQLASLSDPVRGICPSQYSNSSGL